MNSNPDTPCPICKDTFCSIVKHVGDRIHFECATCGVFAVAGTALSTILSLERENELSSVQRAAISHRIREASDQGRERILTTFELDNLIANSPLPLPSQQALNVVRYLGDRISETGQPLREFPGEIHAIVGSPNRDFSLRIVKQLAQSGLINCLPSGHMDSPDEVIEVDLTLAGWERYESERRGTESGGYGFIALKFGDPILDPFLRDVIKPSIGSMGFVLEDMRDAARAGIIDNVMRARIRDAAFVLVDLTYANAGAYWESGYAEGLGKPVLYLCNREVFEANGTHFDTNHCTTVLWDTADPKNFSDLLVATLRRSLNLF